MNRGGTALILGIIVVVVAGIIWLLSSGGSRVGAAEDRTGDVVITGGSKPPKEPRLADVKRAAVRSGDAEVIFEATVDDDLPDSFSNGTLTFRWELSENGRVTWMVSADIALEPTASLLATEFDHRSSTVDDSLPGEVSLDGATIRVSLDTDGIERWPDAFSWKLYTELDWDRTKAPSAIAKDVVPNEGSLQAGN